MTRSYGKRPYRFVLVHGGPGAIGSLKGFAGDLAKRTGVGVLEALQSRYTIEELLLELKEQITENCDTPVILVGHSWGAWLAAMLAERNAELVEKLALVGCPPLEERYTSVIKERRSKNLSGEDRAIFERLNAGQSTEEDLKEFPRIFAHSDDFGPEQEDEHQGDRTDVEMMNLVWEEASELRKKGTLKEIFQSIKAPILLLQGEEDPHPYEGVVEPLQNDGVPIEAYCLPKCGHSPYMERYAKERFYMVLSDLVQFRNAERKDVPII